MNHRYFALILISAIIHISNAKDQKNFYKCGGDAFIKSEKIEIDPKPINYNNQKYKRRLKDIDDDGFKKFNIYVDMANIENDIKVNNLTKYRSLFIDSINKATETLTNLLKVKSLEIDFNLLDEDFYYNLEIDYWDKEKFGTEATDKGINLFYLGIDLVIFGRIVDMYDDNIIASASSAYMNSNTGHPIVGIVHINKNFNFSLKNSQEFFQSIILHEFTHVLGFNVDHFYYYLDILLIKNGTFYINSPKVIEVAKKYYNCSKIDGVQLEDYGDYYTAGSHWEARILLGDYMNGIVYPEEQVIYEFTLALLEDTGYYKVNYYTGGLMRYGKNKGCEFLYNKCVNSSQKINPYFENEFFDSIYSEYEIDNSCSSGRQSRTYNTFWERSIMYDNPNYFNNYNISGWPPADFCPVPEGYSDEQKINYYIGHCSDKGSGEYGSYIKSKNVNYNTSDEMKLLTGETYSNHSFCYLSSLINKEKKVNSKYLNNVRATCYETFCSSKSLTLKINNDYIVCPRSGRKIENDNYEGYLLCPDYNLMCSGTVLCNDMFDCVDKKSEIKKDSYIYDYKIKTSQNIERAENEKADNKTNYELSEDGKCPQYCIHCLENKICNKCAEGFYKTKKENNIICLPKDILKEGYYLEGSLYYECIENCKTCSNGTICEECKLGFERKENKCIGNIENCQEYNDDDITTCKKCKNNFAFKGNDRKKCINIDELEEYYSKDGGISYNICDGEGEENIKNCKKCNYNEDKLECNECKDEFIILDEENNKCYSKNTINDKNKIYYYVNDTHAKTCAKDIKNCNKCENDNICIKCEDNYYLLNDYKSKCYHISEITEGEYYLSEDKTTYYSCKNIKYNSFLNCKNCTGNNTCSFCNYGYTFVDGNKDECINYYSLDDYKYYSDPEDPSNVKSCSHMDSECINCTSYGDCILCSEKFGVFENYRNKCTLLTDFYDNSKKYTMYLIGVEVDYGIVLYMIYDFDLPDDFYLKIPMKIKVVDSTTSYSTIVDVDSKMTDTTVPYRNLESFDEIIIDFFLSYHNDMTKIGTFYQDNYYDYFYNYINYTDIKIDWDNIRDNKNNRINYTINYNYAEYFDYFYDSKLSSINSILYYYVKDITEGPNFYLIINGTIYDEEDIKIKFSEIDNKNHIIEAECKLSYFFYSKIPCSIKAKAGEIYKMEDYVNINSTGGYIRLIVPEKQDSNILIIKSDSISSSSSTSSSSNSILIFLVQGVTVMFILSLIFLIISFRMHN